VKILVTGGAGFIGSHLIGELLAGGHTVVCMDNFDPFYDVAIKRKNLKLHSDHARFIFVEGDIRNRAQVTRVFSEHRFDACVHLAARAGVRPSIQDPVLYCGVNVEGTINLLEEARLHRLDHFVFGSSSSVYGKRSVVPFSEKDPLHSPASQYAATKIAGESLCHVYHDLYGMRVTSLRFFTVYGPRQRPEMAIHKFTRLIHEGKEVQVYGDGQSSRDYTFVTDIVQGIMGVLKGGWQYEVLNLGDSKSVPLIYLVNLIEKNLGKKANIKWMPDQPGDVPTTCADISKANRLVQYQPKIVIEEGIQRFCRWFLENS